MHKNSGQKSLLNDNSGERAEVSVDFSSSNKALNAPLGQIAPSPYRFSVKPPALAFFATAQISSSSLTPSKRSPQSTVAAASSFSVAAPFNEFWPLAITSWQHALSPCCLVEPSSVPSDHRPFALSSFCRPRCFVSLSIEHRSYFLLKSYLPC